MTRAGRTVVAFGIYLIASGLTLLFAPAFVDRLIDVPGTDGLWARITAMLLLIIGYLCVRCGLESHARFCGFTVHTRSSVVFFVSAFVYLEGASRWLLVFGVVDFAMAMWTASALRADARASVPERHAASRIVDVLRF